MTILVAIIIGISYFELSLLYFNKNEFKLAVLDFIGFFCVFVGICLIKKLNKVDPFINICLLISSLILHLKISFTGGIQSIQFQFLLLIPLISIV